MTQACPLSFKQIDGTVARLNALSVSFVYVLFLATNEVAFLYLLAIDFMIRLYTDKKMSPVFQISKLIERTFNLEVVMVDSGAKRVAAFFGTGFVLATALFFHLHLMTGVYVLAAIFLTCTTLELLFAYCIGCKVYFIFKKLFPGS